MKEPCCRTDNDDGGAEKKCSDTRPAEGRGESHVFLVCRRVGKANTSATATAAAAIDSGGVYHMPNSQTTDIRTHYNYSSRPWVLLQDKGCA